MMLKEVTLYNTEGNSDKVYTITILPAPKNEFTVVCHNGRRGGKMTEQVKTPIPVSLDAAVALYESILEKKLAKGYHT